MRNQHIRILNHFETVGDITCNDAKILYSIGSLPKRICELKELGYKINTKIQTGKNQFGERTHWAVYSLCKE